MTGEAAEVNSKKRVFLDTSAQLLRCAGSAEESFRCEQLLTDASVSTSTLVYLEFAKSLILDFSYIYHGISEFDHVHVTFGEVVDLLHLNEADATRFGYDVHNIKRLKGRLRSFFSQFAPSRSVEVWRLKTRLRRTAISMLDHFFHITDFSVNQIQAVSLIHSGDHDERQFHQIRANEPFGIPLSFPDGIVQFLLEHTKSAGECARSMEASAELEQDEQLLEAMNGTPPHEALANELQLALDRGWLFADLIQAIEAKNCSHLMTIDPHFKPFCRALNMNHLDPLEV